MSDYDDAIVSISNMISSHKKMEANESHKPTRTADEMDHYIATHRDAVKRLRKIREELEDIQAVKDYLEP